MRDCRRLKNKKQKRFFPAFKKHLRGLQSTERWEWQSSSIYTWQKYLADHRWSMLPFRACNCCCERPPSHTPHSPVPIAWRRSVRQNQSHGPKHLDGPVPDNAGGVRPLRALYTFSTASSPSAASAERGSTGRWKEPESVKVNTQRRVA